MVQGCDARVMHDGHGDDIVPCECEFRICVDCFTDAVKACDGVCPGWEEPYKNTDWEDVAGAAEVRRALSLCHGPGRTDSKMERGMSLVKQADKF
jgi:cellulose synthase-like protein